MRLAELQSAAARSLAWIVVAALLAAVAAIGWNIAPADIDWEPTRAFDSPWRAFTAIGVHYSATHLVANLGGLLLTAAFGVIARVSTRIAVAWFVAWPLTQFALLIEPLLAHYGGLSGVLHAGVAAVIVFLLATGTRAQRWVAGVALAGLVAKIASETPWGPATRHVAGWDIAVAPLAHATGAIAGAACAGIAMLIPRRSTALRKTEYESTQ